MGTAVSTGTGVSADEQVKMSKSAGPSSASPTSPAHIEPLRTVCSARDPVPSEMNLDWTRSRPARNRSISAAMATWEYGADARRDRGGVRHEFPEAVADESTCRGVGRRERGGGSDVPTATLRAHVVMDRLLGLDRARDVARDGTTGESCESSPNGRGRRRRTTRSDDPRELEARGSRS